MNKKENIYSLTTHGVEVSVIPRYEVNQSNPSIGKFIFSYSVHIVNHSNQTIKLLHRHWHIYDSLHVQRQVTGEGVVGVQPKMQPGETFDYQSWCPINSGVGKMSGSYTFQNISTGETFDVEIPKFLLVADYVLN